MKYYLYITFLLLVIHSSSFSIAATFFCTYELVKSLFGGTWMFSKHSSMLHMVAASLGEAVE